MGIQPPVPGMSTTVDPWLTTLVGALGGAARIKEARNAGRPANWLGLVADIGGGYLSGAQAQAQRAEMIRQESRASQDALANLAIESGQTPQQVMDRLSYTDGAGKTQYLLPSGYHAGAGKQLGEGVANLASSDSLGIANPGGFFGLNPTTANTLFGNVGKAITDQATLPKVAEGLLFGDYSAGGQGSGRDPFNGLQALPSTNSLIPGAAGALGLGGMFPGATQTPAGQLPRANFLGVPTPQGGLQNPAGLDQDAPGISLSGGVEQQDQYQPQTLRNIFLSSPEASEFRLAVNTGGENAKRQNDSRVSLFNNQQDEMTKRENNALQGVVDKKRVDAYGQQVGQIKNAYQALQSGDPELQSAAYTNLTKGSQKTVNPGKIGEDLITATATGGFAAAENLGRILVERDPSVAPLVESQLDALRPAVRSQIPTKGQIRGTVMKPRRSIFDRWRANNGKQ